MNQSQTIKPDYKTVSRSANPYFYRESATQTCSRCLFDDTFAVILPDGECEYCKLSDSMIADGMYSWDDKLKEIKKAGKGKKYDCLIGISGGSDSSTLTYMAVKEWGLKPLLVHFDNNYNSEPAEHNMKQLIQKLNLDHIRYNVNKTEYDNINIAFLEAGLIDNDVANDNAMAKLMMETADRYKIKYLLNGHSCFSEGSTPKLWTRIDAKYIQDVYRSHTGKELVNYPLLTVWDQIWYGLKGIKQVRPFHNQDVHANRERCEEEMKELIGWWQYPGKHAENNFTWFVGSCLLPSKFNVDKRIVYLSARLRTGEITREQAIQEYSVAPSFDLDVMPKGFTEHISTFIGDRDDYEKYDFKKYRLAFWGLMRIGAVSRTFYQKYCC